MCKIELTFCNEMLAWPQAYFKVSAVASQSMCIAPSIELRYYNLELY